MFILTISGHVSTPKILVCRSDEAAKKIALAHMIDHLSDGGLTLSEMIEMAKQISSALDDLSDKSFSRAMRATHNLGFRYAIVDSELLRADVPEWDLRAEIIRVVDKRNRFGLSKLKRHELLDMLEEIHSTVNGGEYDSDTGQRVADVFRDHDIPVADISEE